MNTPFDYLSDHLAAALIWWINNPGKGFTLFTLFAAVITAVAVTITVLDNRRRADDELLDRLGSTTPGNPTSDLDEVLLDWRNDIETPAEIPDLVDTNTAIATIRAGAR